MEICFENNCSQKLHRIRSLDLLKLFVYLALEASGQCRGIKASKVRRQCPKLPVISFSQSPVSPAFLGSPRPSRTDCHNSTEAYSSSVIRPHFFPTIPHRTVLTSWVLLRHVGSVEMALTTARISDDPRGGFHKPGVFSQPRRGHRQAEVPRTRHRDQVPDRRKGLDHDHAITRGPCSEGR